MGSLGVDSHVGCCGEMEEMKLDEIYWLKREKEVLMEKIEKVKKDEEETRAYIEALEKRIEGTEMWQKEMMGFLAKAIHDPSLLMEFVDDEETERIDEDIVGNK
ncbi:hypothetical protein LIER_21970 [Lithospermum erythrorhizon]|uniref:Uncharacterized protein n=1 Tax=Lithospermum erythrorhizon TaxID=34254 RepID=A0AAV3QTP0_LITER